MQLPNVLVIVLILLEVQCRERYRQTRQYSHPLKRRSYNNNYYDSQPTQHVRPHRTESVGHHSPYNYYDNDQTQENFQPSRTESFSHRSPYNYYDYRTWLTTAPPRTQTFGHNRPENYYDNHRSYQITHPSRTETFGHHSQNVLPKPINSFNLNDHPLSGKYNCIVCYKCYQDRSSEESYEDTWSQSNVLVLYRYNNNQIYKVGKENDCPYTRDLCCCRVPSPTPTLFQLRPQRPSLSPRIPNTNLSPQPRPQGPTIIPTQPQTPWSSYPPPQTPVWNPSPKPQTPRPSMLYPQTPIGNPSQPPQTHTYLPPQSPTRNPPLQPPSPSFIPQKIPTRSPSLQPQPPIPSDISPPSNANCICTPFFRCYDEETSSNLTNVVNDRSHVSAREENCLNPNDICCYNLVEPPQDPPQTFSSPTDDCICTPFFKCYDEETSSNLTAVVNDRNQDNCLNPNDICCYNLVQPPQEPSKTFSSPTDDCTCTPFFRCYDQETSSNLTNVVNDRNQDNCLNPNDICCYNLVQPPQEPSKTFSSPVEDCTCTPFFRCYDQETSSNLTNVVNDRNNIQVTCSNPNNVCCYNVLQTFESLSSGILGRSMALQHNPLIPSSHEVSAKTIDQDRGSSVWELAGLGYT